ncbi:MAG TPA: succinate dehydrogenase assembly factor 2 [Steroidobacteraceae bacterium]|jgi:antitoxin CptB|nr:succinate dehydrogenase assembly factor 2 [Steroidobacteraceae bacterium]
MTAGAAAARLRWRCRRGMKELDLLLERYLADDFPGASSAEQAAFADLLELPDPQLAAYLIGGVEPPEPRIAQLASRIRQRGI